MIYQVDLNPTNHGLPPYANVVKALECAEREHRGQTRKYTGEPYIVHPIRVAKLVWDTVLASSSDVCAALLHDVMEDCGVSYGILRDTFGVSVAATVQHLSDQANPAWNRATRKAWEAGRLSTCPPHVQTIKVADLIDNTKEIVPYDKGFAKVYLAEKAVLLHGLTCADEGLHEVARKQLEDATSLVLNG